MLILDVECALERLRKSLFPLLTHFKSESQPTPCKFASNKNIFFILNIYQPIRTAIEASVPHGRTDGGDARKDKGAFRKSQIPKENVEVWNKHLKVAIRLALVTLTRNLSWSCAKNILAWKTVIM